MAKRASAPAQVVVPLSCYFAGTEADPSYQKADAVEEISPIQQLSVEPIQPEDNPSQSDEGADFIVQSEWSEEISVAEVTQSDSDPSVQQREDEVLSIPDEPAVESAQPDDPAEPIKEEEEKLSPPNLMDEPMDCGSDGSSDKEILPDAEAAVEPIAKTEEKKIEDPPPAERPKWKPKPVDHQSARPTAAPRRPAIYFPPGFFNRPPPPIPLIPPVRASPSVPESKKVARDDDQKERRHRRDRSRDRHDDRHRRDSEEDRHHREKRDDDRRNNSVNQDIRVNFMDVPGRHMGRVIGPKFSHMAAIRCISEAMVDPGPKPSRTDRNGCYSGPEIVTIRIEGGPDCIAIARHLIKMSINRPIDFQDYLLPKFQRAKESRRGHRDGLDKLRRVNGKT